MTKSYIRIQPCSLRNQRPKGKRKAEARLVAAGILPASEGGILPPDSAPTSRTPGWKPGSLAGRDACRHQKFYSWYSWSDLTSYPPFLRAATPRATARAPRRVVMIGVL